MNGKWAREHQPQSGHKEIALTISEYSSAFSGRIPGTPSASRQRPQKGALDVLIVLELKLSSATIEKLEPWRLIDGAPQADNPLKWKGQRREAGNRVDELAPITGVIRRERSHLGQTPVNPRTLLKINVHMPATVVGVLDCELAIERMPAGGVPICTNSIAVKLKYRDCAMRVTLISKRAQE
jgi:hypothetical protein